MTRSIVDQVIEGIMVVRETGGSLEEELKQLRIEGIGFFIRCILILVRINTEVKLGESSHY